MVLEECEVARGLKTEGSADFDVLIAWRWDGFELYGWVGFAFYPKIRFLAETGVLKEGRNGSNNLEF